MGKMEIVVSVTWFLGTCYKQSQDRAEQVLAPSSMYQAVGAFLGHSGISRKRAMWPGLWDGCSCHPDLSGPSDLFKFHANGHSATAVDF
jgi:hypothetical protein